MARTTSPTNATVGTSPIPAKAKPRSSKSVKATTARPKPPPVRITTEDYEQFRTAIALTFSACTSAVPLFTVDVTDGAGKSRLFKTFLENLPVHDRPHYTCNACRRFIDTYGNIVTIDPETGRPTPFLWRPDVVGVPDIFKPAVEALKTLVLKSAGWGGADGWGGVTGVFLTSEGTWGTPISHVNMPHGQHTWSHFAIVPPSWAVFKPTTKSASQVIAEKQQDYETLQRALAEYPAAIVAQAHTLLSSGALYRSEKCLGVATWLRDLHASLVAGGRSSSRRNNLVRLAVATAPAGFCHIKSTIIGPLLDDLVQHGAGLLSMARVVMNFDSKMNPNFYQRPQAPPKAGNIARAEEIVGKLASAGALARRYATFADLERYQGTFLYRRSEARPPQTPTNAPGTGVFGHLAPKPDPKPGLHLPPVVVTWRKFVETVFDDAHRNWHIDKIEYLVPAHGNFGALATAVDPEAPAILQWDPTGGPRNPVSWYVYTQGSSATQWGLSPHAWAMVTAAIRNPARWRGNYTNHADGVVLCLATVDARIGLNAPEVLRPARDRGALGHGHPTGSSGVGLCLFPEILKSEYHEVRATLEAHSQAGRMQGSADAECCGMVLGAGGGGGSGGGRWDSTGRWDHTLRVTYRAGNVATFKIDRWD